MQRQTTARGDSKTFTGFGMGQTARRPTAPAQRKKGALLGSALAIATCAGSAHAADIFVPADYPTIQMAITSASAGDRIIVSSGTWSGPGNVDLDFMGKQIVVRSATLDPSTTIIDCGGTARGFIFQNGETNAAWVRGFRIQNGRASQGAGIYCINGSSPTIRDCEFVTNTTPTNGAGAALAAIGSSPIVRDTWFLSNEAPGANGGGAVSLLNGANAEFHDCFFDNNDAGVGGAIRAVNGSDASFEGCTIQTGTAERGGGAVYADNGSDLTFLDCGFFSNDAGENGGAVFNTDCNLSFTDCWFDRNTALSPSSDFGRGGGIWNEDGGSIELIDSVFSENQSYWGGGAVFASTGTVNADATAFTRNTTPNGRGGALRYSDGASGAVTSSNFLENTSGLGGGGIFVSENRLDVTGCRFESNEAGSQGGALRYSGSASGDVSNCDFLSNIAEDDGGAITSSDASVLTISGSSFGANQAGTHGGAISSTDSAEAAIDACDFIGNLAQEDGGAVNSTGASRLSVSGSHFMQNVAVAGRGGAVFTEDAPDTVLISSSIIEGNSTPTSGGGTEGSGGGVASFNGVLEVTDCSFIGNTALLVGGGLLSDTGEMHVRDSTFAGNLCAYQGGGLFGVSNSLVAVENCDFDHNRTTDSAGYGGAIFLGGGPLDLTASRFVLNDSTYGGAIATHFADVRTAYCTVQDNIAGGGGGGAMHIGSPNYRATYEWTRFTGNQAVTGGGGAVLVTCNATFHNGGFYGNDSFDHGGAVASISSEPIELHLAGCLFSGNTTDYAGGAVFASHPGPTTIVNGAFSRNAATAAVGDGGGVWNATGDLDIDNTIFFENTDGTGDTFTAQIYLSSGAMTYDYCAFTSAACPGGGGSGNICADPMFTDPDGADAVTGTVDDDLTLQHGSPCIDAADNNAVPEDLLDLDEDSDTVPVELLPLDLKGDDRFQDDTCTPDTGVPHAHPDYAHLPIIDMGAYETADCGTGCTADFNGDGVVDSRDVLAFLNAWSRGDAEADVDGNGVVDSRDVLVFLNLWNAGC